MVLGFTVLAATTTDALHGAKATNTPAHRSDAPATTSDDAAGHQPAPRSAGSDGGTSTTGAPPTAGDTNAPAPTSNSPSVTSGAS